MTPRPHRLHSPFMLFLALFTMTLTMTMATPAFSAPYAGPSFGELDREAMQGKPMRVVFLGGSLTWGANASNPQKTSMRAIVGRYLQQRWPRTSVQLFDAAIGGTGSDLALFRLERDVLSEKPTLVFLDFTVNDCLESADPEPLFFYETILRTLLARKVPVVQILYGCRDSFGASAPAEPRRVQHLQLNRHYRLGLGDAEAAMRMALQAGKTAIDKCYLEGDGTHPDDPGYAICADGVISGFEQAVQADLRPALPDRPLFGYYGDFARIDVAEMALPQGWMVKNTARTALWFDGQASRWMDRLAVAAAGGSALEFNFNGRFIGIFGEGSRTTAPFVIRIDGRRFDMRKRLRDELPSGEPEFIWHTSRDFPPLSGNLFFWLPIAWDLEDGPHHAEILVPANADGEVRIGCIGTAGKLHRR